MSSLSKTKSSSGKKTDRSIKGSEEGKEYEKITLVLLAERGYELSKDDNSQFRDFSIGREVGIGDDKNLDDIVLRYEDRDSTKNLIFVQIKHKQDDSLKLNYQVLFGSGCGNMGRDFKLRQYFSSYLNIREELKTTKSKELKNGKISYIAIFTNIGIDKMELNKGITLKEAPHDIKTLFALKKSSFERREAKDCYQLGIDDNVSNDLLSTFKKYGDLHRIAKEFAQYVVLEKYKNFVMGTNTAPLKYYHVALTKEVIIKSNETKSSKKQSMENKRYFYAKFRNDFIDNNRAGAKKELLDSIFEAIRKLKPKEELNDDEIKEMLKNAEWRVVSHFGDFLPPENSSELSKIAKEFAEYFSNENVTDKIILGKKGSLITPFEVAFEREVIIISDEVKYSKSPKKQNAKSECYCDAKFREEFINCETGPKQVLKKAIFKAIMESDTSKKDSSDYELENILRRADLKVDQNFGKAQNFEVDLPDKWPMIKDDDIKDFLKCFVLFVNQPIVTDLLKEIYPVKEIFLQGTPVGEAIEKLHQKFRDRIEKALGIYNKASNEEVWLSGEQIIQFVRELQDAIHTCVMTSTYEDKVMKYGSFKKIGKLASSLGNFLNDKWNKVFCVCTSTTLLTSVKVLQYLDKKKYRERYGQISLELDSLKEIGNRVEKAFRSENKLLIVECRHTVNEQSVEKIFRSYSDIIKESHNKKLIIICKQNESILAEKFRFYLKKLFQSVCDPEKVYVKETDDVNLKDFEPAENPLEKKVIVFQEQKEKINLTRLTGFEDWDSYIDYLSQSIILNKKDIADIMIQLLSNDEIEVGNKSLGSSSLEGAYATLFEEINLDSLSNKLLSKEIGNKSLCNDNLEETLRPSFQEVNSDTLEKSLDNNANEIYIFDGIEGSNNKEKIGKLTEYLRLVNEQEVIEDHFGSIGSDSKIQVANDRFTEENFKQICHNYPSKKILWIYVKYKENEVKFILREFYNPNFYFKRKFKYFENVIIKKEVKEQLIDKFLSETFIFQCVNDQQELSDLLKISNDSELKQFQINWENGKINLCTLEEDVEAIFEECSRQNGTVHWLKFENDQIIWCKSHGSLNNLRMYIDKDAIKVTLKEDDLIKEIKNRKFIIISDDPGMGKTTTLTKLYESFPESYTSTHWIIRLNLNDHLQAIRDIKLINGLINLVSVVVFLSKVDAKLNHNLSKSLLEIALHRKKHFSKHLLLVFDGFDEVLDGGDRNKLISLFKFLKEETPVKVWITTRLHYKAILEKELDMFAIEFVPLDDEDKIAYIKKYLKDRLELILKSKVFAELFANNYGKKRNEILQKYTNAFLSKMESVFKENIFRFIGTPLQLYLMLEGSTKHFKIWIENDLNEIPNFSYLGNDLLEIYEKFIDRKYDIYFTKMGINESVSQEKDKFIFDQFNKNFAKSLILKSKLKNPLKKFKYTVLSAGIIKSNGSSNIEFIHTTFRDYFAANIFIHWIKEAPNKLSKTSKLEYILEEILYKQDYRLIRTFINLKLMKIAEPKLLRKSLNRYRYRKMTEQLLLIDKKSSTVLHIAAVEGNTNIACFLLNSLKGHRDVLKKFLLKPNVFRHSALHLACSGEVVRILLDAAAKVSGDTKEYGGILKEFLFMVDGTEKTALHLACSFSRGEVVQILLDAVAEISEDTKGFKGVLKEFLFMSDETEKTALHLACSHGSGEVVRILLDAAAGISGDTKGHKGVLKEFLFMGDESEKTALHLACSHGSGEVVRILLDVVSGLFEDTKEHKEVLKKFLFMCDTSGETAMHLACSDGSAEIIRILLDAVAGISGDTKGRNGVLKEFIFMGNETEKTALHLACCDGSGEAVRILLDVVSGTLEDTKEHKGVLKEFLFMCDTNGETAMHVACRRKSAEIIRILLDAAAETSDGTKGHKGVLKEFLFMRDVMGETSLHIACKKNCHESVKILLQTAAGISENALQELICSLNILRVNVLTAAVMRSNFTNIKLDLDASEKKEYNSIVYECGKEKLVKTFIKEVIRDENSLEQLAFKHGLFSNQYMYRIKLWEDVCSSIVVEYLLTSAKFINDNNETLKKLLLPEELDYRPLNKAVEQGNMFAVKMILSFAKDIDDGHYTLKKLLYNSTTQDFALVISTEEQRSNTLHIACEYGSVVIIKELISYAISINDGGTTLKELVTSPNTNHYTPFELVRNEYTDEIKEVLESFITVAKINNDEDVVNILQEINMKYARLHSSS